MAASAEQDAMPHAPAGEPQSRLTLWLVLAGLLAVFAPTLVWLWGRWTLSVWHNAHGLLILPVVAYFVREELKAHRHLPRSSSALGFVILLPALALHALDAGMHTELLSAAALVMAIPGLSLLMLGVERTKAIIVPLVFLALALPIPLSFTETIHLALRHVATAGTAAVVPMLGIPVFVDGTTLHTAHGALQVADACSGFSTLYAAVAVALLTAYQSSSPARRVLVLLAAAPIAIASNILRVIILVVLVAWRGGEILETFVHPLSGIMTFALSLPILFWLGGRQRVSEPTARGIHDRCGGEVMMSSRYAPAVCVALVLALIPTIIHGYVGIVATDTLSTAGVPLVLDGYRGAPTDRNSDWGRRRFESPDWFERRYSAGGDSVVLTVLRSYDLKALYHHPELAVAYPAASFSGSRTEALPGRPDMPVHILTGDSTGPVGLYVLHYDGRFVADPIRFQIRTAGELLFTGRKPMTLLFVRDDAVPDGVEPLQLPAARVLTAAIEAFVAPARTAR